MNASLKSVAALTVLALAAACTSMASRAPQMGFFVTSRGSGDGANLGGLKGADALCQQLATAAGAGKRNWAAYLSTQGAGAVNARDRIGKGPWYNAKGVLIAASVPALFQPDVNLTYDTALDEKGQQVPPVMVGADGAPLPREKQSGVQHDMLTGSQADGTAFTGAEDRTCHNWTTDGEGSAMLGHSDRRSLTPGLSPWGTAHPSRGCSQQNLIDTGGAGRLYCFAK
jgi:hypothetical protein